MKYRIIISMLFVTVFTFPSMAIVREGAVAPQFRVMDGDGAWLDSHSLRGKVLVGFYENRHVHKNDNLKRELNAFRDEWSSHSADTTFRLAITDASEANAMTRWIWKRNMRSKSAELGIRIYGDWDGSMRRAYGLPLDESIFLIIDKKGILRLVHAGEVPAEKFVEIKTLIKKLTIEK